jgi:hypothetical protein
LWIGGDDLAERRLRAAAITGTERLLRVAHLLLDFRRLRQSAGGKEKQKQSAHGRKFYTRPRHGSDSAHSGFRGSMVDSICSSVKGVSADTRRLYVERTPELSLEVCSAATLPSLGKFATA